MIPPQISPVLVRFWSTSHLCNTFWRYQFCVLFRYFRSGVLFLIQLYYYHSIHILQDFFQVIQMVLFNYDLLSFHKDVKCGIDYLSLSFFKDYILNHSKWGYLICMHAIAYHQSYEIKCILKTSMYFINYFQHSVILI